MADGILLENILEQNEMDKEKQTFQKKEVESEVENKNIFVKEENEDGWDVGLEARIDKISRVKAYKEENEVVKGENLAD